MKQKFLNLSPENDIRYSVFVLNAYGYLSECDSSGEHIWVDEFGKVWIDTGVIVDNTYYGERELLNFMV